MKLLKVIFVVFIIYFIRRFIQMYKALRVIQAEREMREKEEPIFEPRKKDNSVEAEYKVID